MITQNEIKVQGELANKTDNSTVSHNPQPATTIHDQFFLIMSTISKVLTIPLLTVLFTWAFQRRVSVFKYSQGSASIKAARKANI